MCEEIVLLRRYEEEAGVEVGDHRWQGQQRAYRAPSLTSPTRLYGFKIHPMAYQLQLQAASNFKSPVKTIR